MPSTSMNVKSCYYGQTIRCLTSNWKGTYVGFEWPIFEGSYNQGPVFDGEISDFGLDLDSLLYW